MFRDFGENSMMFDAMDFPIDESSMSDGNLMDHSFENGDPSEASYTLAEVMDQESVANIALEDVADVTDAVDAVSDVELGWTGKLFKHVKKMWDETGAEMNEMNMSDAADQMSSFVANESSHNMSGVLLSGKTQL